MSDLAKLKAALPARIMRRIHVAMDGCWVWTGPQHEHGYARVYFGQRMVMLHRVVWTIVHGAIPKGLVVCHRCDNPPCARPSHLFIGTQGDNMRDCAAKGRVYGNRLRGSAHPQAKLSDADVRCIRSLLKTLTQKEVAERFGVSKASIGDIAQGRSWSHVR